MLDQSEFEWLVKEFELLHMKLDQIITKFDIMSGIEIILPDSFDLTSIKEDGINKT